MAEGLALQLRNAWLVNAVLATLVAIMEWVVAGEIDDLDNNLGKNYYSDVVFARVWVSFIVLGHLIYSFFVLFDRKPVHGTEMAHGINMGMTFLLVLFMMSEAANVAAYDEVSGVDAAEATTVSISLYIVYMFLLSVFLFLRRKELASPPSQGAQDGEAHPAETGV